MRAYLNTLGIVSALGSGISRTYSNLMAATSPGTRRTDEFSPGTSCFVAQVPEALPTLPRRSRHYDSRNNRLLLHALEQIEDAVRRAIAEFGSPRVGVVLGTSTSGIAIAEEAMIRYLADGTLPPDYDYRRQRLSAGSDFLSDYLELEGPSFTISTACSSSAHAVAQAAALIEGGVCDAVVTGGADSLSRMTVRGFMSLEAISAGLCNPLSLNRDGINLGEGSALFLMTREPADVVFLGAGASSDAHHISAPHPEGRGAIAAMQGALTDAKVDASQIDYVNLHGTGTPLNDAMECRAIERLFGTATAVSSTKGLTGHTLGAAGAIELSLCWLALTQGGGAATPPHRWDGVRDPSLPVLPLQRPAGASQLRYALSNSFAFGGNNASLIIGRAA